MVVSGKRKRWFSNSVVILANFGKLGFGEVGRGESIAPGFGVDLEGDPGGNKPWSLLLMIDGLVQQVQTTVGQQVREFNKEGLPLSVLRKRIWFGYFPNLF